MGLYHIFSLQVTEEPLDLEDTPPTVAQDTVAQDTVAQDTVELD